MLCLGFGQYTIIFCFFFFKQKTAYEMRISDWSSDVCSSDLGDGHATKYDAVVAAGGDGTIGEVANGLPLDSAPLGIFPLGTANVLAMETGLPLDPAAVMQAVLHGPVAQIWPGFVNDRLFTIMAGVGFDAHVEIGRAHV